MKKKAVVTGGAGFIGAHIARECVARGFETHVVDNLAAGKRENIPDGAIFHEMDVLDTAGLTKVAEGSAGIFHLAALPRVQFSVDFPQAANETNVSGMLSVLVAARDAKAARVVYAASSSAYGDQAKLPLSESMPANPANPYGLQKYIGELYLKMFAAAYSLSGVSLRFFNVYGPGMDPEGGYALAIPKFLAQVASGKAITITGDGTQTRDFTHVRDVVRACLLALESANVGAGEVMNIGSGRNVSVNMLADLIDGGAASGRKREYIPARAEARDTLADFSLAKKLLGWEPSVRLEDGIAELRREWNIT